MSKKDLYIFALVALFCIIYGFLVGDEYTEFGAMILMDVSIAFLYLYPIPLIVLGWFILRHRKILRWIAPLLLPVLLLLSFGQGKLDHQRAYHDCIKNGEKLRAALKEYHKAHGQYPDNLSQLGWPHLPGRRVLGGNMWDYEGEKDHYRLCCWDFLSRDIATESEPFRIED
jgi:hypothetical protein